MKTTLSLLAVFSLLLVIQTPIHSADPGKADEGNPIAIGRAGSKPFSPAEPLSPKVVKCKTTNGPPGVMGQVSFDVKNDTGGEVTDLHVKVISPQGAQVKQIATTGIGGNSPFTEQTPTPPADPPATEAVAKSPVQGGNTLPNQGKVVLDLIIVDAAGTELNAKDVTLHIWWTRGINRNIVVSATSPHEIGSGDPRATCAAVLDNAGVSFNATAVQIAAGSAEAACNDLILAECDGFRFQNGTLVVSPNNSAKFALADSTRILAYDQNGADVLGTRRFSASDMRIDERGNFVFTVGRRAEDSKHVMIIIRGLVLTNIKAREAGEKIHGSVSGAPVAGHCLHELYHVATFNE